MTIEVKIYCNISLYFDRLLIYLHACLKADKLTGSVIVCFLLQTLLTYSYIFSFTQLIVIFQSGCEEENECQNGGKMVWHPVKPFRCECRKNYSGEYCEKCE